MNRSDDPKPQPPAQPELEDCCRSGCAPCVFDLYEEALERYRAELKAWQQRHVNEGKIHSLVVPAQAGSHAEIALR